MGVRHFPYTILLILLLGVSVLGVYIFPPAILLIPYDFLKYDGDYHVQNRQ